MLIRIGIRGRIEHHNEDIKVVREYTRMLTYIHASVICQTHTYNQYH